MSQLLESLMGQFGGSAVSNIAQKLGVESPMAQQAITMALPMLLGALNKNASTEQGANALTSTLAQKHDGSILNDLAGAFSNPQTMQNGAGILGHLFGGQQEAVTQQLGNSAGLGQGGAANLLQMLAPVVMGALGQQQQQSGASGLLSSLMGAGQAATAQNPQAMGMISQLLDRNNDGNVVDDVLGMVGSFLKK